MTSAKQITKSLIKFETSTPFTAAELAKLKPEFVRWRAQMAKAKLQADDMFEAYHNLDSGEFIGYLKKHPPLPMAVLMVIRLAEAVDDPEKPSKLGKIKAQKLYGKAKADALLAWQQKQQSGKKTSKSQFAQKFAKSLETSGTPLAAATIYSWLPKNKK